METAIIGLLGVLIVTFIVEGRLNSAKLGRIEKTQEVINGQFMELGRRIENVERDNKEIHAELRNVLVEFAKSVATLTNLCERVISGR